MDFKVLTGKEALRFWALEAVKRDTDDRSFTDEEVTSFYGSNCKAGRLRPTGLATTSADPQTNRVTNDLRGYKCDNCGYPEGGQATVVAANEQAAISEYTNTTTPPSSPAATTAAAAAISNWIAEILSYYNVGNPLPVR